MEKKKMAGYRNIKIFKITPDETGDSFPEFLMKVDYMNGFARIWTYLDSQFLYSDIHFLSLQKDWEGFIEFEVDHFEYGMDAIESAEIISIAIKAGAYICDQMMAVGDLEDYDSETLEEALARCNCYDGPDKNPGIIYEELEEEK